MEILVNTVNLSQDTDSEAIRGLTGRRDISGGVFWIDPARRPFLEEAAPGAAARDCSPCLNLASLGAWGSRSSSVRGASCSISALASAPRWESALMLSFAGGFQRLQQYKLGLAANEYY